MVGYLKKISGLKKRLRNLVSNLENLISNLGWLQAGLYMIQGFRCSIFPETENYILLSKNAQFPLICRHKTSDRAVFEQIFIQREYSCLDGLSNVNLVIDCAANVGYSSAYFLTRFPLGHVICVEPDLSNFMLLERNLTPYKDRVKLIHSGIWSHPADLKISETPYRDGDKWTVQVRECKLGEVPEMRAIDVGTLLKESDLGRISILKMDIEGAEAVVFAKNYESWLPFVDNIVIELHDDSSFGQASDIFLNAISCKSFNISSSRELTVCRAHTSDVN